MLHYPQASWRPISHNVGGTIVPRAVVWHTAVDGASTTSLFDWFNSPARKGTSAHGFIAADGAMEQYVDFGRLAGHAFAANNFAIGIETHDGGHPDQPWTPQQVAQMVAFMRWCRSVLGIPIKPIDGPSGSGHGYHSEFGVWNKSAHACPGPVRIAQLQQIIAQAAANPTPTPQPLPPLPPATIDKETETMRFLNNNYRGGISLYILGDTYHEVACSGHALGEYAKAGVPSLELVQSEINDVRTGYGLAPV